MSWTRKTVNGYLVGESDVIAFANSAVIASPVIDDDLGGKKTVGAINITVAGTDQITPFKVQMSYDGTAWVDADTMAANITLSSTGVVAAEVDLTDTFAPMYRLVLAPGGSAGTTGRVKFIYTYKR